MCFVMLWLLLQEDGKKRPASSLERVISYLLYVDRHVQDMSSVARHVGKEQCANENEAFPGELLKAQLSAKSFLPHPGQCHHLSCSAILKWQPDHNLKAAEDKGERTTNLEPALKCA